jgi:hypothetical protein
MGGEINLIGMLLMVACAALAAWLGRKLSAGRRERKHQAAEQAARATESRQVRRARERQQK